MSISLSVSNYRNIHAILWDFIAIGGNALFKSYGLSQKLQKLYTLRSNIEKNRIYMIEIMLTGLVTKLFGTIL